MLLTKREISVSGGNDLSDEKLEALMERIEGLLDVAMESIETDFDCVFGNDKEAKVRIKIEDL